MKLLLYCTKAKPDFLKDCKYKFIPVKVNGKIVAECDFEVSKIELHQAFYNYGPAYFTKRQSPFKYFSYIDLLEASCLKDNEMLKYLGNKGGYAIHIKNLHIFDEPKELDEYCCKNSLDKIKQAPQNMMYVYNLIDDNTTLTGLNIDKNILISIRPEWLCKILNGEKTIEIRKKVLKEMR